MTGSALLATPLLWSATNVKPAQEPDEVVLAHVRDGIAQHRQGEGVIVARGDDGMVFPNATIRMKQTRHLFLFGCNFFGFERVNDPKLEKEYRSRFAAIFNYATLPFYWANYESQRSQPDYICSELTADWCRDHGIKVKGHPLVWDHPANNPHWLPEDLQEVGRLSRARIPDIGSRFKGRIDMWDVVNDHLRLARSANPKATLLVNDYRLAPAYHRLLDLVREGGWPLYDVIGLQSHMHDDPWPLQTVWQLCETYAKLGVPLHFTEATIVSGVSKGPWEHWLVSERELEDKQARGWRCGST